MDPALEKYLKSKYGEDYQTTANADYAEQNDRVNTGSIISSIGDVMSGRQAGSQNEYFSQLKKQNKENTIGKIADDKKNYMVESAFENEQKAAKTKQDAFDPTSSQSIAYRKMMERSFPDVAKTYGDSWQNVSAGDQDNIFKPLQLRENIDARKQQAQILAGSKDEARQDKLKVAQDKKNSAVTEIQDRYNNIKDSIGSLKTMIKDNGTQEMFGPENKQMDQYITSIATDMAKLVDPTSVARESEVAGFKKMMFEPGFWQRESTMNGVLSNFEQMVDKRLGNAYAVRGLQQPEHQAKQSEATAPAQATVNIITPDGRPKTIPADKLQAALKAGGKVAGSMAGK